MSGINDSLKGETRGEGGGGGVDEALVGIGISINFRSFDEDEKFQIDN